MSIAYYMTSYLKPVPENLLLAAQLLRHALVAFAVDITTAHALRPCCCIRMRLINARRLSLQGPSRGQSTRRRRGEISTWRPRGRESKRAVPPFTFQTAAADLASSAHESMTGDGSKAGRRFYVYWRVESDYLRKAWRFDFLLPRGPQQQR